MVDIMRWVLIGIGILFTALFVRRSVEVGIGPAGQEVASIFPIFGKGLGEIGTGLGALGSGFSQFLRGTLDPFGLVPMLIKPTTDVSKPSTSTSTASRVVVMSGGDMPSGNTGGFNMSQSTAESTPRSGGAVNPTTRWYTGAVAT
jgi:hypothetical protein